MSSRKDRRRPCLDCPFGRCPEIDQARCDIVELQELLREVVAGEGIDANLIMRIHEALEGLE